MAYSFVKQIISNGIIWYNFLNPLMKRLFLKIIYFCIIYCVLYMCINIALLFLSFPYFICIFYFIKCTECISNHYAKLIRPNNKDYFSYEYNESVHFIDLYIYYTIKKDLTFKYHIWKIIMKVYYGRKFPYLFFHVWKKRE